ncbi:zinc finger family protein [Hibiscus syriacus]|uniref:non-specific serine/threonine protein kinase n=1 Tax=Hibiscus syriacus TaxID=106335 RepID=A0A6A3ADG6_HIBSY|nr:zinc finger family protein [Hibiscus syriacus]
MGKITSGFGFSCGIVLSENNRMTCWGRDNSKGQLNVPLNKGLNFASGLALGEDFSCAIRRSNGTVVCWSSINETTVEGIELESIVSGLNFTCGLTTSNFSIVCWGPGWPGNYGLASNANELPLGAVILPGLCVQSPCNECGLYAQSSKLWFGTGNICKPSPCFNFNTPSPLSLPPPAPPPEVLKQSSPWRRWLLSFVIVGAVGVSLGICSIIYCFWTVVCCGRKKVHNSVQPTITRTGSSGGPGSNNSPSSRSFSIRRHSSRAMKRQISGTSSKHADRAEEFSLA